MTRILRPEVNFDPVEHAYQIEGEDVMGVSTVAKVGGVEDAWGIASAWGFRIGYEGAWDVAAGAWPEERVPWSKDELRAELKKLGLTPWSTRDRAADRGSWVHDALEELGQSGDVPDMGAFREKYGDEAAGHMRSVLRWFLHFRPVFVALEVQVASRTHRFAGRYDVRCLIDARRLLPCLDAVRQDPAAVRIRQLAAVADHRVLPLSHPDALALCLVDLKTSKGVYPTSHFVQLEGYEGAGVEMGFPATDARIVLNTWPTGEHDPARDFCVSWSTYDHFLAYLGAMRAIRQIKADDPEVIREKAREQTLLSVLPARSRELVGTPGLEGMDSRSIGFALGKLRKRGKVAQDADKVWSLA